MNAPIKPKLKPQQDRPAGVKPLPLSAPAVAAKVALSTLEEGETSGLNHLATLGGLGLLAEIAHFGEHLAGEARTIVGNANVKAIDPRNQVDPRRRFIPR